MFVFDKFQHSIKNLHAQNSDGNSIDLPVI